MTQLTRRNDELSKEVGRIRLLEEQRKEASTMPVTPTCMAPPSTSDSSRRSARVVTTVEVLAISSESVRKERLKLSTVKELLASSPETTAR